MRAGISQAHFGLAKLLLGLVLVCACCWRLGKPPNLFGCWSVSSWLVAHALNRLIGQTFKPIREKYLFQGQFL
jgi:hypothetical protein